MCVCIKSFDKTNYSAACVTDVDKENGEEENVGRVQRKTLCWIIYLRSARSGWMLLHRELLQLKAVVLAIWLCIFQATVRLQNWEQTFLFVLLSMHPIVSLLIQVRYVYLHESVKKPLY